MTLQVNNAHTYLDNISKLSLNVREFLLPFLVNVTNLSASVAQKPLIAICSIFSPVVWSFPTLPLQTEVIGIADNHCCGMPPRGLSYSNPMCVCMCERGDYLWNQRGGDRENQRGEEADVNMPRHHTVSSRNHEVVCFGRVSPYFTFCFWEKLKTFGFGGEGCLKTCLFPFLAGLLSPVQDSPSREQIQQPEDPKSTKKQTECERSSIKVFNNN